MKDHLILKTTVSTKILRRMLLRGIGLAILGLAGLFYGGIFMTESLLSTWGIGIFILSFTAISWGLLPYRHLSRLQLKPNEIYLENQTLTFYAQGIPIFSLPLQAISQLTYEKGDLQEDIKIAFHVVNFFAVEKHQPYLKVFGLSLRDEYSRQPTFYLKYFNLAAFQELHQWFENA